MNIKGCPGGVDNPCNGRGNCSQGLSGTGLCQCDSGYTGRSCEVCEHHGHPAEKCFLKGKIYKGISFVSSLLLHSTKCGKLIIMVHGD